MANAEESMTFKHITIEPEDDELVVRVGSLVEQATKQISSELSAEQPARKEQTPAQVPTQSPDQTAVNFNKVVRRAAQRRESGAKKQQVADTYRETTLEDLKHDSMSKLQRGVLIGIGVIVIVLVAYALFL